MTNKTGVNSQGDIHVGGNLIVNIRPDANDGSDVAAADNSTPIPGGPRWLGACPGLQNFHGRTRLLDDLEAKVRAYLEPESRSRILDLGHHQILVTGMGGVGKSEFVRAVLGRLIRRPPSVEYSYIWINCSSPVESIEDQFNRLAKECLPLNLFNSNLGFSEYLEKTYKALSDKPTIIIFDNAKNKREIQRFFQPDFPSNGFKPFVIVTSRNRDISWKTGNPADIFTSIIHLRVFEEGESLECMNTLLSTYTQFHDAVNDPEGRLAPTVASDICDNLPIGMQQAAKFLIGIVERLSLEQCNSSDLLRKFDTNEGDFLKSKPLYCSKEHEEDDNPKSLYNLFENVNEMGKDAKCVLNYLACLYPRDIPVALLAKIFDHCRTFRNKNEWLDTLLVLDQNCVIDRDVKEKRISIHKLVQNVALFRFVDKENKLKLFKKVRGALFDEYEEHGEYSSCKEQPNCVYCKQDNHVKELENRTCLA